MKKWRQLLYKIERDWSEDKFRLAVLKSLLWKGGIYMETWTMRRNWACKDQRIVYQTQATASKKAWQGTSLVWLGCNEQCDGYYGATCSLGSGPTECPEQHHRGCSTRAKTWKTSFPVRQEEQRGFEMETTICAKTGQQESPGVIRDHESLSFQEPNR